MIHTQIQWTEAAEAQCVEIQAEIAAGLEPALVRSCNSLYDSIREAVLDGSFMVPDEDNPLPENDY